MKYESSSLRALIAPGGGSGVFPKSLLRRYSSSAMLSAAVPADDGKHLARDVAGALGRCEKDVSRRDLLRLRGTLHRRIRSEFADILRVLVRGIEGRPDWSRRDGID